LLKKGQKKPFSRKSTAFESTGRFLQNNRTGCATERKLAFIRINYEGIGRGGKRVCAEQYRVSPMKKGWRKNPCDVKEGYKRGYGEDNYKAGNCGKRAALR